MICSRRDLAKLMAGAPFASALMQAADSKINGVMVGAQSYSFRDLPLDQCVQAMKDIGLGYCELWQGHLEPKDKDELKKWRVDPPLDSFRQVRKKFDDAGIVIYAYNYSFRDGFSDQDIENGFRMADALGVKRITASSNVDLSSRIDPFAQKYKTYVGFHNHDNTKDPNEFARPEAWDKALAGRSKYMAINLDIGHFTAANYDPVQYLEQHHDRILTLHIKDRKRDHGANMPFGEGDTKIKEVLQVLKTKKYSIPAMIEYEYGKAGSDTVAEVRRCFEYVKQGLA
jgi:sugar phosphate isomerase/epimerase